VTTPAGAASSGEAETADNTASTSTAATPSTGPATAAPAQPRIVADRSPPGGQSASSSGAATTGPTQGGRPPVTYEQLPVKPVLNYVPLPPED
jgi:hypothetical protein